MPLSVETLTIIGTGLAVMSYAGKIVSDMKQDIKITTTFNVETKGKLEMVNHRLSSIERSVNQVESTMDDLSRYMMNNSDLTVRKHQ
ncbi:MAG: hypothetical protein EAZ76_01660 [Nostocales cyanobacterium]|nr:MAG: hypothetical protein EAZ87_04915 [Nostocales cyanobacterium]TAF20356.1 MAG: hypothetical protein EAZ76_01660 [Nostocales cyanobacterium]